MKLLLGGQVQTSFLNGKVARYELRPNGGEINEMFDIHNLQKGEFISVSTHITYGGIAQNNVLYPNGPSISGIVETKEYFYEECFPINAFASEKYKLINKYYVIGKVYTKYALIWEADEKGVYMPETEEEITDGNFVHVIEPNGRQRSFCFEIYPLEKEYDSIIYSIYLYEPSTLPEIFSFNYPQSAGNIFRKLIPVNSYGYYHISQLVNDTSQIKNYYFSMNTRKGVADMYIYKCKTFPSCSINETNQKELITPNKINNMALWNFYNEPIGGSLDINKYIMVVKCKDQDNDSKGFCEVDTYINHEKNNLALLDKENSYHYVKKGENRTIGLNFPENMDVRTLIIDIMVFTGDLDFYINTYLYSEEFGLYCTKHLLANKILFKCNLGNIVFDDFQIGYYAYTNSFFSIKYNYDFRNEMLYTEKIPSGDNYLVSIEPFEQDKVKTISIPNHRTRLKQPFFVSFFQYNCEFEIKRKNKEIEVKDGYAQEIILENSEGYKEGKYDYDIKVIEADASNYDNKMCLLYVSGYETNDTIYNNDIIISDGVNQQFIYQYGIEQIRFVYPAVDLNEDVIINFNAIDLAKYNVKIFINDEIQAYNDTNTTVSKIFYVNKSDIQGKCQDGNICPIKIYVTKLDLLFSKLIVFPMAEITVRGMKHLPSYLQKGIAKRDFTIGDNYYYLYTDIGRNDEGEILVSFLRDFGTVYGKIVPKNQIQPDNKATWKGIYHFPESDNETELTFNLYTRKLEIPIEKTKDCINGCYLLLSILISQIGEDVNNSKFYPFSIISKILSPSLSSQGIPKITIQVDEYIVGNVDKSRNGKINQFYEFWFSRDSQYVYFELQSDLAKLYINVGGQRPTTINDADFVIPYTIAKKQLTMIFKSDIIALAEKRKLITYTDSLEDINMVIGVYTEKTDSLDTELFSLKVTQYALDPDLDIYKVDNDQKVLCRPRINNSEYRCLFMLTYDEDDVDLKMPILLHAESADGNATTKIYAKFIDTYIYDEFIHNDIKANIPNKEAHNYESKDGYDFLPIDLSEDNRKKYLFISVMSNSSADITLMTSMPVFNDIDSNVHEFYLNPTSYLLSFSKVDTLRLKFFSSSNVLINIVSLYGSAEIFWTGDEHNVYYITGSNQRLSISSSGNDTNLSLTIKKKSHPSEGDVFYFYANYITKSSEYNFNRVKYGKSLEIAYPNSDLPLFLFTNNELVNLFGEKLDDLMISVTFKNLEFVQNKNSFASTPFYIKAAVIKDNTLYRAKEAPELSPSKKYIIYGVYDPVLSTGQIAIPKESIEASKFQNEDTPLTYLSITKKSPYDEIIYKNFSVEALFSKVNDELIPVEKVYIHGKYLLKNNQNYGHYYRLKAMKNYIGLEISFNSYNLDFSLNSNYDKRNDTKNETDIVVESNERNGKKILILNKPASGYIFLNIFLKNTTAENLDDLSYYVFKYANIDKKEDYKDSQIIENGKLNCTLEGNKLSVSFNSINKENEKTKIKYSLKVINKDKVINGENYNTIALSNTPYYTYFVNNPQINDAKIVIEAKEVDPSWEYVQVIAQIKNENIIEYVAYEAKSKNETSILNTLNYFQSSSDFNRKLEEAPLSNRKKAKKKLFIKIFIIATVLFLLEIAGFIVLLRKKRNKRRMRMYDRSSLLV